MTKNVVIKSNGHGISLKIKDGCNFSDIISELKVKLSEAESFFKDAHIVLEIQGRKLNDDEVNDIVMVIEKHSKMVVLCVVPHQDELEEKFLGLSELVQNQIFENVQKEKKDQIEASVQLEENEFVNVPEQIQLFEGTLRSGQDFVTHKSAIIIGDVNPGASVMAGENVIVFGSLLGNVTAGNNGNSDSYVLALDMNPGQVCINGIYGRSADERGFRKKNKLKQEIQIARLLNNGITIENFKNDGGK